MSGLVPGDVLPIAPACFLDALGDAAAEGVVEVAGALARLAFRPAGQTEAVFGVVAQFQIAPA